MSLRQDPKYVVVSEKKDKISEVLPRLTKTAINSKSHTITRLMMDMTVTKIQKVL